MPDNLFDGLRDTTFDVVANTMGKIEVSWTPSSGGPVQTTNMPFNDPDSKRMLGDIEYMPGNTIVEWRKPFMAGLKESVDANNSEYLQIGNVNYYVRFVKTVSDGNTYVAVLDVNP